ncbi:MAG: hypothetical protein MHM6MM_001121 [Cercozoa sp. M6MM]
MTHPQAAKEKTQFSLPLSGIRLFLHVQNRANRSLKCNLCSGTEFSLSRRWQRFIEKGVFRYGVLLHLLVLAAAVIGLIVTPLQKGQDVQQLVPFDSFLRDYFDALEELFENTGPPVDVIAKQPALWNESARYLS